MDSVNAVNDVYIDELLLSLQTCVNEDYDNDDHNMQADLVTGTSMVGYQKCAACYRVLHAAFFGWDTSTDIKCNECHISNWRSEELRELNPHKHKLSFRKRFAGMWRSMITK